jgi:TRAP-type C4-dicarboxylate transport system substrate-binding protein
MLDRISRRGFVAGSAAALAVPTAARAQGALTLRYGNAGNAQTISNTFNAKLAKVVEERTQGAVKTEIFAGTLGGEQKLIESMALGSLDIYNGAYTGTREFDIFYSPYFFKDGAHAKRVVGGALGQKASAALEKKYQARFIGFGRLGPWVLATKKKIASLDEIKGMKLRAPQIEGQIEALKFLGANPTPIAFNEIYLALQSGTVDGFVSALNPSVNGKFYEPCKYIMQIDFGLGLDKQCFSTRAWARLTPAQQKVYQDTFAEIEETDYHQAGLNAVRGDFEKWKSFNGADSVVPLDAAKIAKQMEPLNKKLADEVYGAGTWDMIQKA